MHRRTHTAQSAQVMRLEHAGIGLLLLIHAPLVLMPVLGAAAHFGAAEAMAMLTWLTVLIYWSAAFFIRLDGLQAILLPIASISLFVSLLLPQGRPTPWLSAPLMQAHFSIAMLAYGFLAVAAGMAVLMRLADRDLHHPAKGILSHLPPLLALEKLLFSTLQLGFALLTATLISGTLFSEEIFGKPVSFNHKSVLSIAAWIAFGILIWGRRTRGWRGRVAAYWTLAGFTLLFLAYVGNRFVLDSILHR